MHARLSRRLRVVIALGGAMGLVLVALAVAVPLVLRGERLAALVARSTASLCGSIRVSGGRVGATAVFDWLFHRATWVDLQGLRVVAPDGEEIIVAEHMSARVAVRRSPWRLDVYDLRLQSVRWGFVEHRGRADFVELFRRVPAGQSREMCATPVVPVRVTRGPGPSTARPTAPPQPTLVAQIHQARLEDVDLRLDFTTWGLSLDGLSAQGQATFVVGGPRGPHLSFDVGPIVARRGGSLRVGAREQRWAARVPFENVEITRFSTLEDAPADMWLDVTRAVTGRSTLSGRARFTEIFRWSRRMPREGLELDARWTDVGDAVEALKRNWGLTRGFEGRVDGDVTARLRGPMTNLTGALQVKGRKSQLDVALEGNLRLRLALALEGLETKGALAPSWEPILAGRLSGRLRAHGQLAAVAQGLSATLDEVHLTLDRTGGGPWPRRLMLSSGAASAPAPDRLQVSLGGVELVRGRFDVRGLGAALDGATLAGRLAVQWLDEKTGRPRAQPLVNAGIDVRDFDLARWLPQIPVTGRVSMATTARGTSDDLALVARVPPGSTIAVVGQRVGLPTQISGRLRDKNRLSVGVIRFRGADGAALAVGGLVSFDGPVDLQLGIERLALGPFFPRAPIPMAGRLDSALHVTGTTARPRIAGQVAFTEMRVGTTRWGDGAVNLTPAGRATLIEGRLTSSIDIRGRVELSARPTGTSTLTFHDVVLDPLLRLLARGLTGHLSGRAEAQLLPSGAVHISGDANALELKYGWAKAQEPLTVRNVEPVHVTATESSLVLSPAHMRGSVIDAELAGTVDSRGVLVDARGWLSLGALAERLRPWLREPAGTLDIAVHSEGPVDAPVLSGEVSIRDPLRLWPPVLAVPVQANSGRVRFDGWRLTLHDLALSMASVGMTVGGGVRLDPEVWTRTELDTSVAMVVDGAALARRLPKLIATGHGRARLQGRVRGTLGAPLLEGSADFDDLGFTIPGAPLQLHSLFGHVEARGRNIVTRSVQLALYPGGKVEIGSAQAPASFELTSVEPPEIANLDIPVRARSVAMSASVAGVRLDDLDLDLRVTRAHAGPLRVVGNALVGAVALERRAASPPLAAKSLRASKQAVKELFPEILLDVNVRSKKGAIDVDVPHVPDLALDVDCHVTGSPRAPRVQGRAHGDGIYSRLAIFFYDVFSGKRIRHCGAR